jgi:AraC-like DNA-binding protein
MTIFGASADGGRYGRKTVAPDMTARTKNLTAGDFRARPKAAMPGIGTTIAAGYPRAMLEFAVSKGADRQALLQRSGLSASLLADQDRHVPVARYVALIEAAAALTAEPGIALQFGKAVRMQDISIVGLICEACETTFEVGAQLNRYASLVIDEGSGDPAMLMRATAGEEGVWIEFPSDLLGGNRYMAEAEIARLVWNARAMFAHSPEFQQIEWPKAVHFRHAEPAYRSEYERIFQAPIVFGSRWNALLTDPRFLTLKQPPVNRYVFGVLSARAEALLKEVESARTLRGRVESLLMRHLHTGEVGIGAIAARLGLSRAALYRKLKEEDVTFERVLDELRHRLALHYLDGKKVSVSQTAYLLGFSDPAAFSRAFKRWTGKSPRARGSDQCAGGTNSQCQGSKA